MSPLGFLLLLQAASPLAVVDDRLRPDHDMLDYALAISIPNAGTSITASATLRYVVRGGTGPLVLDFDSVFTIDSIVRAGGTRGAVAGWRWGTDGALQIDHWGRPRDTLTVAIHYRGTPRDGLFIQNNVHGDRTAFADNWPNRARHWFPSEDHPSDKATASFAIEVPAGWKAIANGRMAGVDSLPAGRTRWRWREDRRIPVYTMVIGAGRLAVTNLPPADGVPQSVWTYPQDSAFAVDRPFRRAVRMVEVFTRLIGPFPYEKLAHVQTSTRFGGMENSSAIFYDEKGYSARTMGEGVVAHEIAHQWFGDAATELDWHHLWLSEGFASYLEPLFYQMVGEDSAFSGRMQRHRDAYMRSDVVSRPVIDTAEHNLFRLLNANNYPKGAWILHMLRGEVGDSAFFRGLREYYRTFRDSVALTSDFAAVMERQAGKPLQGFLRQWLLQPGYPKLDVAWTCNRERDTQSIEINQVQDAAWGTFDLRLPMMAGGKPVTAMTRGRRTVVDATGCGVIVDPTSVLMDLVRAGEKR